MSFPQRFTFHKIPSLFLGCHGRPLFQTQAAAADQIIRTFLNWVGELCTARCILKNKSNSKSWWANYLKSHRLAQG